MIVWLTGNSGAGKTTLAQAFTKWVYKGLIGQWIHLDGDEMRSSISCDLGLSKEDREEHNLRIARLAKVLTNQDFNVIISVIAPFQLTRDKINEIINCKWIYLKRTLPERENYPYEEPNCFTINVDRWSVQDEIKLLADYINGKTYV